MRPLIRSRHRTQKRSEIEINRRRTRSTRTLSTLFLPSLRLRQQPLLVLLLEMHQLQLVIVVTQWSPVLRTVNRVWGNGRHGPVTTTTCLLCRGSRLSLPFWRLGGGELG